MSCHQLCSDSALYMHSLALLEARQAPSLSIFHFFLFNKAISLVSSLQCIISVFSAFKQNLNSEMLSIVLFHSFFIFYVCKANINQSASVMHSFLVINHKDTNVYQAVIVMYLLYLRLEQFS